MPAPVLRPWEDAVAALLAAALDYRAAREAELCPPADALDSQACALQRIVGELLAAGIVPRLSGLSPPEIAVYRAALRYGALRNSETPAQAGTAWLRLVDCAVALPSAFAAGTVAGSALGRF
jgi:hypothetical protein